MCRKSCETIIGSDQEFAMIVIIGEKKAFSVSISDHSKATKCTVGWNKIIWEVFLDIFCTFKPVYSTQCPRKSSKGWWNQEIDEKIDFFQRQFSTILGLKMSCLQNKNYLNAEIRCIWHIQNSFVSKSSIKKVKMLVKSAKIDEKNRKNFEKKIILPTFSREEAHFWLKSMTLTHSKPNRMNLSWCIFL